MNTPVIEKNIPMPEFKQGRQSNHPGSKLNPGESFFLPAATRDEATGVAQRLRSFASQRKIRLRQRFSVALVEGGVRMWRLPDLPKSKRSGAS